MESINSCNTWWLLYQNQERKGACSLYKHRYVLSWIWFLLNIVLCGTKCWCFHTVIETNWVLFIKIHDFIRKILLPLECKSLPPPTLQSFCAGVTVQQLLAQQTNRFLCGCGSLTQLRGFQVLQSHIIAETVLLLKGVRKKKKTRSK